MKSTINRILLVGIGIFFLPIICLSQKKYVTGFIINNSNQRIEGEVAKQSDIANCKSVSFKEDEDAMMYHPEDVKFWGINDSRQFVSQTITVNGEEKQVFLEYIVRAEVSLLAYYEEDIKPRFFVQKDDGELREISTSRYTNSEGRVVEDKKYIGILNILLSDCNSIQGDIATTSFNIRSLSKLIVKYNNCVNPDNIIFASSSSETEFIRFSVALAYNMPQYEIIKTAEGQYQTEYADFKSVPKNFLSFGIGVGLNIPKVKGLSANLGFMFGQTEIEFLTPEGVSGEDFKFSNTILEFPIQVRYAYNISRFNPYVCVGYSILLYAKHDSKEVSLKFETQHHGWNAGVGLDYQLFKSISAFFEFKYQSVKSKGYNPPGQVFASFDYLTLKTNVISLTFGVSF